MISALGVHEFEGHGVRKLNDTQGHHQIIYSNQRNHYTYDRLTKGYRDHINSHLK